MPLDGTKYAPEKTAQEILAQEQLRKFIHALRHTKYKQWRGSVFGPDNTRCALGVYYEEVNRDFWPLNTEEVQLITQLNDFDGYTFAQIADYLERKYLS